VGIFGLAQFDLVDGARARFAHFGSLIDGLVGPTPFLKLNLHASQMPKLLKFKNLTKNVSV